jgi:hypothetical protein
MLPPAEETGHKLGSIYSSTTTNGESCTFHIETRDRHTKDKREELRFWVSHDQIGPLVIKVIEAASLMNLMRQKAGNDVADDEPVHVFNVTQAGAGAFENDLNVALQLQCEDGPMLDFSVSPDLARELGELLIAGAKAATTKTRSH